jgi:hypothetical protein
MKKVLPFALAAAFCLTGIAAAQTIDDIQVYNPITGAPASPYNGQTVTVSGTVYVQGGTYNSGTHYIQSAHGGIQFFKAASGLVIGDNVEITGAVSAFSGEIQINNPSVTNLGHTAEPTPTPTTPAGILAAAEPYEWIGEFVAVTGQITAKTGNGEFRMMNTGGSPDTLICYVDTDTHIDLGQMAVGDIYLVKSPVTNFNGVIELKPRMQSDLIENPGGDTFPVIQNVNLDDWVVRANVPTVVRALITDNNTVSSATVYYRSSNLDGTVVGSWLTAPMNNTGSNIWAGTIPAPHGDAKLDFYVSATDNAAQTTTNPGNAPTAFFATAVGLTTIYAMQYVDPDATSQDNAFNGKVINVTGVVTAGTSDAGAPSKFVVQERNPGPYGGYRFGGVLCFEGTASNQYYRGDIVEIAGKGSEFNFLTEIIPHNGNAINLVDFADELPTAERAHTRVLADDVLTDGNGRLAEAYESVWVKTYASSVLDTLGFGEYIISDTGARADTVVVDTYAQLTYEPTIGDLVQVEGFMDYAFGSPRVTPIFDENILFMGQVPVEDLPTVQAAGGFTSVYPNPFNPRTNIEFVVNRADLAQLNIYNIRGELVRQIFEDRLPVGSYSYVWDGTDKDGRALASGQYFARLRIGAEVYQVRKLSLVK